MAVSEASSQRPVQIQCHLCEGCDEVNWFCKNCSKNLCKVCKIYHAKIPSCENHSIVAIFDGLKLTKFTKKKCRIHKELYQFYCKTCQKRLCSECLTQSHKQHDFTRLANLVQEVNDSFKEKLEQKAKETESLQKSLDDLERITQTYTKQMKDCKQKVKVTAAQWRQDIDRLEKQYLTLIEGEEKRTAKTLDDQYQDLKRQTEKQKQELLDLTNNHQQQTSDFTLLDFIMLAQERLESMNISRIIEVPDPRFEPNKIGSKVLGEFSSSTSHQFTIGCDQSGTLKAIAAKIKVFKSVLPKLKTTKSEPSLKAQTTKDEATTIQSNQLQPEMKESQLENKVPLDVPVLKRSFVAGKHSHIVSINLMTDDKAWIGFHNGKLKLMSSEGKKLKKVHLPHVPWYTTTSQDGEFLLVSCGKSIQKITIKGEISQFTSIESCLQILDIATAMGNTVFACLKTETSRCKVVRLSSTGHVDLEVDPSLFDSLNPQSLYCAPEGNICVTSNNELKLLDPTGNVIKTQKNCFGMLNIEADIKTLDHYGNIVAGKRNVVYIFNTEMYESYMYYGYTVDQLSGRDSISAVTTDRHGVMWTGTMNHVLIVKYLDN